ncbi:hypothetical protein AKJ49_01375 [candidate division MSBL1 archaeon SCGC-AAA382A03]|uniref:Hydrogenase maturation protease n=1 Tax=candidate division MSBL1 archaeon SCGC-AAA382A03 TaxID=1698278 RepID=A0A133VFE8_9EURY|nr:hypothetical protein AKJ49_01375 [candidate division MSBL1 archaeon SCGC-AAA382A03]
MEKKLSEVEFEGRVVIMGIGNEFRGDDSAGVRLVEGIRERIDSENVLLINAGNVPEKFTSNVKKFDPDFIFLVDSVEIGEDSGTVLLVDPEDIVNQKVSSHRLPLSMLIEYLEGETEAEVVFIGIQPERREMGVELSEEVRKSVRDLVEILSKKLE